MLLHLPTGSGKTVIAALIIERLLPVFGPGSKVLFVAHRKELLDQTASILARQIPDVPVSIEQGRRAADLAAPQVNNERFQYLLWHLSRATGWQVDLAEPSRGTALVRSPRALLRSMLPEGQRIASFSRSRRGACIEAEIDGIQAHQFERIKRAFEQATGLTLMLRGQFAFDF